jgi:regulatory protein
MDLAILKKAAAYCAYQERTQREVRQRLRDWGVWGDEAEELIARLIEEGYLNEERFARAFAGGKFRIKQWGRVKIEQELRQRGITGYNLRAGLSEIDEADYRATLREVLDRKAHELRGEEPFTRRQKVARYAAGKGYESELIWALLGEDD